MQKQLGQLQPHHAQYLDQLQQLQQLQPQQGSIVQAPDETPAHAPVDLQQQVEQLRQQLATRVEQLQPPQPTIHQPLQQLAQPGLRDFQQLGEQLRPQLSLDGPQQHAQPQHRSEPLAIQEVQEPVEQLRQEIRDLQGQCAALRLNRSKQLQPNHPQNDGPSARWQEHYQQQHIHGAGQSMQGHQPMTCAGTESAAATAVRSQWDARPDPQLPGALKSQGEAGPGPQLPPYEGDPEAGSSTRVAPARSQTNHAIPLNGQAAHSEPASAPPGRVPVPHVASHTPASKQGSEPLSPRIVRAHETNRGCKSMQYLSSITLLDRIPSSKKRRYEVCCPYVYSHYTYTRKVLIGMDSTSVHFYGVGMATAEPSLVQVALFSDIKQALHAVCKTEKWKDTPLLVIVQRCARLLASLHATRVVLHRQCMTAMPCHLKY